MIGAVVLADRPLSVVGGVAAAIHYAELGRVRCPRPVKTNRFAPVGGDRVYVVGRCVLDREHDGSCYEGGPEDAPRPARRTLCAVPMREWEPWVPIDVRPGDRVCTACADAKVAEGKPCWCALLYSDDRNASALGPCPRHPDLFPVPGDA